MKAHFLLTLLHGLSAVHAHLHPRADADVCVGAIEDNEGDALTAPTSDRTANIGAEFETPVLWLSNTACSKDDTDSAKRKIVAGRSGPNWMLTADTVGTPGKPQLEYVLDCTAIKLGTGDAARAGAAVAADLAAWQPWNTGDTNNIEVEDSPCNPWSLPKSIRRGTDPGLVEWAAQITAPMPLEGLYSLMGEEAKGAPNLNIINGGESRRTNGGKPNLVFVTTDFFQATPNGMTPSTVTDDVLGFCSLVLTYAKGAKALLLPDQNPKLLLNFMPLTEFITMFQQVKSKMPGDLFTLFNTLALDRNYCSGSLKAPVPNGQFAALTYTSTSASMNINTWIDGIGAGSGGKDALSVFDESIDGSIGGLGTVTENMFNSQRAVPIFEFRDLPTYFTKDLESFISATVSSTTTTTVPTTTTSSSAQSSQPPATITPAPAPSCDLYNQDTDQGVTQAYCLCDSSITLSPLTTVTAYSESCAYKSIPTGTQFTESVTTMSQVWTSNCAACTLAGGLADAPTCTTVSGCTPTAAPTPTMAAWVGNLSTIEIGDAEDGNGGKDLASEMFTKLKGMCDGSRCRGDHAEMDNVETVVADGEEPLKPAMYLQTATFDTQDTLEKMLFVGISSWIAALNDPTLQLCKNVTYEAEADETGSGCGQGPIPTWRLRRKFRSDTGEIYWERSGLAAEERRLKERCIDNCGQPPICHYEARICSAPNEINDPYGNRLNIGVTLDKIDDGFSCEDVTAALTAAITVLVPELLEIDAIEGVELEAVCGVLGLE
ncbi:hypothetical protein F5Y17DRAFT_470265 [Xylariaceae sp. FL0594]|nr:hypothetical protein F5Y17DRAFT_470265 [Xylariaceae sp. FL0594]